LFDGSLPQEMALKIQNNKSLNENQKEVKLKEARSEWEKNLTKIPWLDRPTTGDASETALIKFF
jgi:sodium/potassium-transporting ATPase subunit alpha